MSAYVHYAYATNSDGSQGFTLEYTGVENYVGWYTDFTVADSSTYTDYEWQLFKGSDGINGLNAFIHYAYANNANGTSGFSLTYTGGQTYVGWYTSFSSIDSTNPADYKWSRFRGFDGASGPGLVSRGLYSSIKVYYADADRRDVVQYGGAYYAANAAYSPITGTWNATKWTQMNYFSSVATDILLANDATVTRGLVMGDADNKGFIRSYGMNSLTSGNGFYLDGNGPLRLGDVAGNNLYWNGTTLALTGSITATSLTLTNNATITKGLIMGTSATNGYIRSYGMSSLTNGTGFFLNGLDGKFTFGNTNGSRMEWDGSNLNVYTSPYSIELDEEAKTIIAKNHTKSAVVVYYKVWAATEPTSYTMGSSIPANSSITISNSAWKPQFRYYVKVRFGSSGPIYTDRFTNPTDNRYFGYSDVISSITGGSLDTISAVFIPILANNYIERYAVYINGIVTVSSSTGTASLTLNQPIGDMVVVASPHLTNSGSSGGDLAYGYSYIGTGSTSYVQLTKDYASNTNSNKVAFTVSGYYMGGL